jgi:glycosyltransferase involved in cell wall biosynthesis/SAM-dependent methyltransferase
VPLKAWHSQNWAETLSRWAALHGRKFLFVGLAGEADDVKKVQGSMSEFQSHTRVWMPPGGTIDELIALSSHASGYVGHDTGPMHIAAALGKPVLAVFGGGHKLRFAPAVEPSVVVTVGVPCRGCQWVCSFEESHCVKAVPVDEVVRAAEDLEAGRVRGRDARVLEPSKELQARMIHESARIAQTRLRTAADLSRQLELTHGRWNGDLAKIRAEAEAAVEHAHVELGNQLREKESMIRRQDEQLRERDDHLREKESLIREQDGQLRNRDSLLQSHEEQLRTKEAALHEQHALLQKQGEALSRAATETERIREHATAAQRENEMLGGELAARAAELARLQDEFDAKSREAAELSTTIEHQRDELARLQEDVSATRQQVESAVKLHSDELGKLREQMQKLDERLRAVEPQVRPRRPLKQVLVDFVIGPQHFYPPPPRPLPGITVVTVTHNDEKLIRETIESVIGQTHAHVQYVVVDRGSTDSTLAIVNEYRGRIDKIISEPAGTSAIDALANGYGLATYDVLARLDPGDVYEPGALTRVAEHFRDHPTHKGATIDDAVNENGWRFATRPLPTPDVYQLLNEGTAAVSRGVFVTTNAYKALLGLTRDRGAAAEWDLWLRLDRRYGIHRGSAQVRTIRRRTPESDAAREAAFESAREVFEQSFGPAGRIRCMALHAFHRVKDTVRGTQRGRLWFPVLLGAKPQPAGVAPARVPADQPVCPIDGRMPDRLLFSARDTIGRDDGINYVYYDESADLATVYPPIDLEKLQRIYREDSQQARAVSAPEEGTFSAYAGYARGHLARILSKIRSPYWLFRQPEFGDPSVTEMLRTIRGIVDVRDKRVRFLNVACFEGAAMETLKKETSWTLSGTETNPDAARIARSKGFTVWETSAQDAPLVIPAEELFDVIYVAGLLEHLPDPLLVLRRLRQILAPGGRIVIDTPNLDSKTLDVFGPTWSQWQMPYHRTLVGRRGLRELARRASFRIDRLRTRTHPAAVVKSVQQNDLGLAATVPDTAEFPADVASRGVLLAGWARTLWDWRGRGDTIYAVLRAE